MGRDYWAPFIAMCKTMVEAGTISAADLDLMLVTDSVPDAMAHIELHAVQHFGLKRRKVPQRARSSAKRNSPIARAPAHARAPLCSGLHSIRYYALGEAGVASVSPTVGAVHSNVSRIIAIAKEMADANVTIGAFPEQVVGGYPPEDLVPVVGISCRPAERARALRERNQPYQDGLCDRAGGGR
jgi:hypothetical protein